MISSQKYWSIFQISLFYSFLTVSHSWNLISLNISDDTLIWKFAVWRNRAFLAIPKTSNEEKQECRPTLVEVFWPEINLNSPTSVINTAILPFSKNGSLKRHYKTFRSVTGLDVDIRGRLWILDAPSDHDRWPRIIIYDLKRNDRLVSSTELTHVSPKYLKNLVIDPFENQWGSQGYFADAGDETIIVYNLGQNKWWRLKMSHGPEIPLIHSIDLAISRNSILYITGRNTHDLFSINLEKIRFDEAFRIIPPDEVQNVTITRLGKKLGSSIGLFSDLKDGLHYFMTSERASVRWDTKSPLNAKSHSILIQNNDVPCITDYIMDTWKNVWGLVNSECPGKTKKNASNKSKLKFRTIRVTKYSSTL